MNQLRFATYPVPDGVTAGTEVVKMLVCFRLRYVKSDGTLGEGEVPAARFSIKHSAGAPGSDSLQIVEQESIGGLQSVDR